MVQVVVQDRVSEKKTTYSSFVKQPEGIWGTKIICSSFFVGNNTSNLFQVFFDMSKETNTLIGVYYNSKHIQIWFKAYDFSFKT